MNDNGKRNSKYGTIYYLLWKNSFMEENEHGVKWKNRAKSE